MKFKNYKLCYSSRKQCKLGLWRTCHIRNVMKNTKGLTNSEPSACSYRRRNLSIHVPYSAKICMTDLIIASFLAETCGTVQERVLHKWTDGAPARWHLVCGKYFSSLKWKCSVLQFERSILRYIWHGRLQTLFKVLNLSYFRNVTLIWRFKRE